jgi:hypothetical protein
MNHATHSTTDRGATSTATDVPDVTDVPVKPLLDHLYTLRDINKDVAAEYAQAMRDGAIFPPIDVWTDGSEQWVSSGGHRTVATHWAKRETIRAIVHQGTLRDAILHATSTNQGHGLRRSVDDKRSAVLALLDDLEWAQWSDHELARQCGVSHPFVGKVRAEWKAQQVVKEREQATERAFYLMQASVRSAAEATAETEATGNVTSQAVEEVRRGKDGRRYRVRNINKAKHEPTAEEVRVARALREAEKQEKQESAAKWEAAEDARIARTDQQWKLERAARDVVKLLQALHGVADARTQVAAWVTSMVAQEAYNAEQGEHFEPPIVTYIEEARAAAGELAPFLDALTTAWAEAHPDDEDARKGGAS